MKQAFIFISILTILFACVKEEKHEGLYIRGRLFLYDTITQSSIDVPLANKRVVLAQNNGDTLNYLYADTTDANGYFLFDLLNDGKDSFVVRYEENVNTYQYKASQKIVKGDKTVVLTARLDEGTQNGFVLKTTDEYGNTIPDVTVHLYNSLALATQNNSTGAIETFKSSKDGKLFKLKLSEGVYYINAEKTVDTATFQQSLKQIIIPAKGIVSDQIRLTRKLPTYKNGVTVIVMDSLGGFIPNTPVYLYNSQVLAASNDPSSVFASFTTDSTGKKTRYDLPAGDYYINVNKVINDSLTYQSLINKITLPVSGFITNTIIVRKKQ